MTFLLRVWAICIISIKRLWVYKALTLATLIGLITVVAFVMTIPLYAEAINYNILLSELNEKAETTQRPPFAYRYSYLGALRGMHQWEALAEIDTYLTTQAGDALGLPQDKVISHFETNTYKLFPEDTTNYAEDEGQLAIVSFALTHAIDDHINLIEGEFPLTATAQSDSPIPVLLTESFAQATGLQVGEIYIAFNHRDSGNRSARQIPVQVAGIWQPRDANSEFWFYAPDVFDDLMLVSEDVYINRLSPIMDDEIRLAVWSLLMDGQHVDTADVNRLLANANNVLRQAERRLPGIAISTSPADALRRYREAVRQQTQKLLTFSVPLVGLSLVFIGLVAGLTIDQRRNEIAVMRGRGATSLQLVGAAFLEGVLLGLIALVIGAVVAVGLTHLVGKTRSFLDFTATVDLRIVMTPLALSVGALAVGAATLAQTLPTLIAARQTVMGYKQTQSRNLNLPWWQRVWLDVGLLLVVIYAFDQLRRLGSLQLPWEDGPVNQDPYQNPFLFLLPAVAALAITLIGIRLIPLILRLALLPLKLINRVGLILALQNMSRSSRNFSTPFILLTMMVSLAIFTASIARTLDLHLLDQAYYRSGADVSLVPDAWLTDASLSGATASAAPDDTEPDLPDYYFLPIADYKTIPGVNNAARVGRYRIKADLGNRPIDGTFFGVDRVDFGQVAFWRGDFAAEPLGSLLNSLATASDSVLVSRDLLNAYPIQIGDTIRLTVTSGNTEIELPVRVVGVVDYFTGWYPQSGGHLFVGNLDYLFARVGGQLNHTIWLQLNAMADKPQAIETYMDEHDIPGQLWRISEQDIVRAQQQPDRQGVLGLLSVGLIAIGVLTILGIMLYAVFSFRKQAIELGVLRAIGLSMPSMIAVVVWELVIFMTMGIGLGIGLGIWMSHLMIPFFQGGSSEIYLVPPFIVEISWPAIFTLILFFGLLLGLMLMIIIPLLARMKIFQAVKLGETV